MSKRRFKVFKRHLPEDWMVVTRWNGWPIRYDRFGSFRAAHDYMGGLMEKGNLHKVGVLLHFRRRPRLRA